MNVTVGVLTWNPIRTDRLALLDKTVASLEGADVTVFNNGSTDGFTVADYEFPEGVRAVDLPRVAGWPDAHSCGYGMNKMARTLDGDIIILSNDDIVWHEDAIPTLRAVWKDAPDNLAIVSGLLEPTFALPNQTPWNLPVGTFELGGHRLLVRRSVPGGAWTFRRETIPHIFPVSTFPGVDDVPACNALALKAMAVAALDLADHAGESSTWGNASYERLIHTPLEAVRAEYGL